MSEDLLVRFQLGDRDAFDRIVGRFHGPLTRFFYRLCWDLDQAEDLAQDVFLKVLRGVETYRPQGRLSTYLFKIATNRWIDHYRSMRPRPRLRSLDEVCGATDDAPLADQLASDAPAQPEMAANHDERERLRQALDRLPLGQRLVFELAVYQQLPYPEVAALLGIPHGTVKSRMHHAIRRLRELLGDRPNTGLGGAPPQDDRCTA